MQVEGRKRMQRGASDHDPMVTPLAKRPKNADIVIKAVTSTPPPVVGTQTDTKLMVQRMYSSANFVVSSPKLGKSYHRYGYVMSFVKIIFTGSFLSRTMDWDDHQIVNDSEGSKTATLCPT